MREEFVYFSLIAANLINDQSSLVVQDEVETLRVENVHDVDRSFRTDLQHFLGKGGGWNALWRNSVEINTLSLD